MTDKKNNTHLYIDDIFYQDYSDEECGIPSHWDVKYFTHTNSGYPQYKTFTDYEDAASWAKSYGYDVE